MSSVHPLSTCLFVHIPLITFTWETLWIMSVKKSVHFCKVKNVIYLIYYGLGCVKDNLTSTVIINRISLVAFFNLRDQCRHLFNCVDCEH